MCQGNPVLICNTNDTETAEQSNCTVNVPKTVDCLQGILTVIPMQLLSLHIAELKNLDVRIVPHHTAVAPLLFLLLLTTTTYAQC